MPPEVFLSVIQVVLDVEGTVWVAGELWTAVAESGLTTEDELVEGLRLRVRRHAGGGGKTCPVATIACVSPSLCYNGTLDISSL